MKTLTYTSFLGIFVLVAEILNLRKFIVPIAVIGLAVIGGLTLLEVNNEPASYFHGMVQSNYFTVLFSTVLIGVTALLLLLSNNFHEKQYSKISDYVSLTIFTLAGALAMVSFGNLAMFFIGLEIMSIAFYLQAGTDKRSVRSNEAAMKYFLMGSFASGILLFGITLIYGATASFDLSEISSYTLSESGNIGSVFYVGVVLILIGLLFKVSAVPFHFWTPDVYEGAPFLTTALMATLGKVAAFAAFFKLFWYCFNFHEGSENYTLVIGIITALTILVGNFSALKQTSFKRMLAFSGITNAGFMLMAIVAFTSSYKSGVDAYAIHKALFYYAFSYAISTVGAFAIAISVAKQTGSEEISAFKGLGHKHPVSAFLLTLAMLSIAGIPPLSGFFAKYFLFSQAISAGHVLLVLFAILNSIVAVYYYLKVVFAMFSGSKEDCNYQPIPVYIIVAGISVLISIVAGVFPNWFF